MKTNYIEAVLSAGKTRAGNLLFLRLPEITINHQVYGCHPEQTLYYF